MTTAGGSPHLARLAASPRPTGGAGIAAARAYCFTELRRLGFAVREEPFEYSAFAGRFGAPSFGALLPLVATLAVVARHQGGVDATTGLLIAVVASAIVAAIQLVRGVVSAPIMRRRGVNLEATRGPSPTRVWLVAHLDSKSQPVPMLVRVAGVVVMSIGLVAVALALAAKSDADVFALVVAWLGGVPLLLSVVGNGSQGALDNASGVAVVLDAAAALSPALPIGVLISDAEELSLAGARVWARSRPAGVALNCDSVDDGGPLVAMFTRNRPSRLLAALEDAATASGERLEVRRLVPGILTDSVALADAKWETLTLSRGSLRTLLRIHTPRDSLASMRGVGVAGAARVLARTASKLV